MPAFAGIFLFVAGGQKSGYAGDKRIEMQYTQHKEMIAMAGVGRMWDCKIRLRPFLPMLAVLLAFSAMGAFFLPQKILSAGSDKSAASSTHTSQSEAPLQEQMSRPLHSDFVPDAETKEKVDRFIAQHTALFTRIAKKSFTASAYLSLMDVMNDPAPELLISYRTTSSPGDPDQYNFDMLVWMTEVYDLDAEQYCGTLYGDMTECGQYRQGQSATQLYLLEENTGRQAIVPGKEAEKGTLLSISGYTLWTISCTENTISCTPAWVQLCLESPESSEWEEYILLSPPADRLLQYRMEAAVAEKNELLEDLLANAMPCDSPQLLSSWQAWEPVDTPVCYYAYLSASGEVVPMDTTS